MVFATSGGATSKCHKIVGEKNNFLLWRRIEPSCTGMMGARNHCSLHIGRVIHPKNILGKSFENAFYYTTVYSPTTVNAREQFEIANFFALTTIGAACAADSDDNNAENKCRVSYIGLTEYRFFARSAGGGGGRTRVYLCVYCIILLR